MRSVTAPKFEHGKNALFGLLGFLLPTVIVIASYRLMVLALGEVEFGVYVIITSIGGAMSFADMGISSANIKFVAKDAADLERKSRVPCIVWTAVSFYAALGSFIVSASALSAPWLSELFKLPASLRDNSILLFALAALQVAITLVSNVFVGTLKALGRFDLGALVSIPTPIVSLGGGALGVHLGVFGLTGLLYVGILGSVLGLLLGFFVSINACEKREIHLMTKGPTIQAFKRMFGFSAILTLHAFVAIFFNQIQRLLVGWALGPQAVSIFHLPHTLLSKIHALFNASSEFLYPAVSSSKCAQSTRNLYLKIVTFVNLASLLSLSLLLILSDQIFSLWLGSEITEKITPLITPLAVAFFFIIASIPTHHLVNGIGRPSWNVYYSLFNLFVYTVSLAFLTRSEIEILDFADAFMISNAVSGLLFQIIVEFVIWPTLLKKNSVLGK